MTSNGVKLKVSDVHDDRVVIEAGAYKITFKEGPGGKAREISAFFISEGSYISKDDVPYEFFKPAIRRANVIFHNHRRQQPHKEIKKEKKEPVQLTLPFS